MMHQRSHTYTTNGKGVVAVCVPYATVVPGGYTAYIAREISSSSVMLFPVAEGGEVLPHGAAVILQGPEAKSSFTLTPAAQELINQAVSVEDNLLAGTYASKEIKTGQGYYLSTTGSNFYRASSTRTIDPFTCWLPCGNKNTILQMDTTTPIRPIQSVTSKPFVQPYTISGQIADKSFHGIVIRDGRKEIK